MLTRIYVAKDSNIFLLCGFTDINYSFLRNKKIVIKKNDSQLLGSFFRIIWRYFYFARKLHYISISIYELHNVN